MLRQLRKTLPSKGDRNFGLEYRIRTLAPEDRRNRGASGEIQLCEINSDWTQGWLQKRLEGNLQPEEPKFEFSADSALDIAFLDEILNEQRVTEIDDDGYERAKWVKVHKSQPNDYRDCVRLAKVAG